MDMNPPLQRSCLTSPFNGPIEIGLRAIIIMCAGYPQNHSLQRLVICDYLLVHSGDIPDGPQSLHPDTPHRSGELLVRRGTMQQGLELYESRGLVLRQYHASGVFFAATEHAASFIDSFRSLYVRRLKERAQWVASTFDNISDIELQALVSEHIGDWGAEFEMESVLWAEE